MTIGSLDTALSGLKAAQKALDVTANNVANASTEGYTRKTLPQSTLIVGGSALGVRLQAVTRSVDKALLADLVRQNSVMNASMTKESYLSRIQSFHGSSESERALSSEISKLRNSFTELSAQPDSVLLQNQVTTQARSVATRFNDFSTLINDMRNQAQDEIRQSVNEVNQAIKTIDEMNLQISTLTARNQSTADLEDKRDQALRKISEHLQVSTFTIENNQIVVQTRQGALLSGNQLVFSPNTIIPTSYYPGGGAEGIFVTNEPNNIEITQTDLGGKIGALLELRDQTLPQYQAQIDELAQKLAERFDSQGLRLFTDNAGNVPPSVAPPAPVGYTGFAAQMQVNPDVLADPSLVQKGTNGNAVLPGSNEVIKKIIDFTFGDNAYMQANGTTDISAGTLWTTLGLDDYAQVVGNIDISDLTPSLDSSPDIAGGAQFDISIGGGPASTITINPGDTPTDLVNNINTALGAGTATLNGLGQLVLEGNGDITLSDVSLGAAGIAALGHSFGTTNAQNPTFTVQAGSQSPVTISIDSTDTATDLLADLNAVSGINAYLNGSGELVIEPTEGGDLAINDGLGSPVTALGLTISGVAHNQFRRDNLGANANVTTGMLDIISLENYGRSVVSLQSEQYTLTKQALEQEQTFYNTLDQRNSEQTGVDIDEEISNLVRLQTAYTAAARMISASERLLDDLLSAFS